MNEELPANEATFPTEPHPIASIFPPMDWEELEALMADIRERGVLEPITLYEGKILDGRNRAEACRRLGIMPPTCEFTGDVLEAVAYVWARNRLRRHLTSSQAAVAEARRLNMCEAYAAQIEKAKAEAHERKRRGTKAEDLTNSLGKAGLPTDRHEREVDALRARMSGTNRAYIPVADRLVAEAPDLAEAVEQGRMSLPQAKSELKRRKKRAALEAQAAQAEQEPGERPWQILHGDCLEVLPKFKDEARLIFAEPPCPLPGVDPEAQDVPVYEEDYVSWAKERLGACLEALTNDGSLWLLVDDEWASAYGEILHWLGLTIHSWIKWYAPGRPSSSLPFNDHFLRTSKHLFYCVVDPTRYVFHEDEVRKANGKPWDDVWGIDPPIPRLTDDAAERLPDFPRQLPLALLDPIIRCASDPGDLVLDPFSGSATTGVAAIVHGRRYVGIEQDESYVALSRLRLEAVGRVL
jgi:site-specific DNA-methyltransferase (adenine-specific)